MSKNIVLCADGTGNRGGETPDTNVYRMYHAVDIHQPKRERKQITFYDNGVGTSTNKYIRGISGALGFGFGKNIQHLYAFLARNYDPGDIVYLFGFSRGAATVRAFGGMLQECGLIDRNHPKCMTNERFDPDKFSELVEDAFKHYKNKNGSAFRSQEHVRGEVRIKFMGIWDTVSALGFPYQRTGDSIMDDLLERPLLVWPVRACDNFFDFGPLAHKFYNYTPNKIVDNVYHAIAIDDERKSFLPRIWDEKDPGLKGNITQVWFAGMHSDVGGSYNQTGLAYETMAWMMERAEHHGMDFFKGALDEAKDKANVHGKLHNSRDGMALYYRYAPRNIESLCANSQNSALSKLTGPIKIHQSVVDRMQRDTDGYAPGLLPTEFEIVGTPIADKNTTNSVAYGVDSANPVDPHVVDPATMVKAENQDSHWTQDRVEVEAVVQSRRRLYRVFADYTFAIIVAAICLWSLSPASVKGISSFFGSKFWSMGFEPGELFNGDIIRYFTPEIFDPFIKLAIVDQPTIIVMLVMVFVLLFKIRTGKVKATSKLGLAIREKITLLLKTPTD
jgi:hypothetical protein